MQLVEFSQAEISPMKQESRSISRTFSVLTKRASFQSLTPHIRSLKSVLTSSTALYFCLVLAFI